MSVIFLQHISTYANIHITIILKFQENFKPLVQFKAIFVNLFLRYRYLFNWNNNISVIERPGDAKHLIFMHITLFHNGNLMT